MDTSLVAERATLIKSSYLLTYLLTNLLTYLLSRLQRKKKDRKLVQKCWETIQEAFTRVDNSRPLKRLKLKRHRTAYMHFPTPFPGKHLN